MSDSSIAMKYYERQRSQKQYMDALLELSLPSPYEVVLAVEKGSATASIFLGDRVEKVYAVEANGDGVFSEANRKNTEDLRAPHEFLPHFNVSFLAQSRSCHLISNRC